MSMEEGRALSERNWKAMYPMMCEYAAKAETMPEWFATELIGALNAYQRKLPSAGKVIDRDSLEFPLGRREFLLGMGLPALHSAAVDVIERFEEFPSVDTLMSWKQPYLEDWERIEAGEEPLVGWKLERCL